MADEKASLAVSPMNLDENLILMLLSLSRPSFSHQFPLPLQPHEAQQIARKESPGPSSTVSDDKFILSPLVRGRKPSVDSFLRLRSPPLI